MSWIDSFLALFNIKRIKIRLHGHERDGGYTYITSPELPGFSFMLEPGEDENIRSFIDAIDEPLMTYIDAYYKAESRKAPSHLAGLRQSNHNNFVAELAYA